MSSPALMEQMNKFLYPVGEPGWSNRGFRAPAVGPNDALGTPQAVGEWTYEEFERGCAEEREVMYDARTGEPTYVVRRTRKFSSDPVLSVSVASIFSNQNTAAVAANADASDAFLRVSYGSSNRGPESVCDFDLITGTGFQIIGARASFYVVYPVVAQPQGTVQPVLDVSVSVGVGSSAGTGNVPRRTKKVGALVQNQESGKVAVPPFAHLALLQVADATSQVVVKFYGSTGSNLIAQALAGTQFSQAIPVPNGARFFTLTNTAAGSTGASVVFFLNPS